MTQRSTRESVGELIDGRYRLLRVIGEGAMGRVYEAEHVGIGKRVALKILHRNFSNLAEVVARFRSEARLATRIGNAHIVDVTDSGVIGDGRLYFAMEYLAGVELRAEIGRGPFGFERALRIAAQIAEALSAAHQVGVIHRDLKPENVMLVEREGDTDFVKILDFGIAMTMNPTPAQSQRRLTQPGLAMGTPEYMAPEQALALAADARSDIYALGAILYEMVTGQQPFQADTYTEILVRKASTEPPSPRELRRDLPEEIEAAILKAMARDAGSRHQSMHALIEDITRCLEWRAVAASAATAVAPSVRPAPVRPAPVRPTPVRDGGTGIAYDETAFALPKDSSDRGVRRNRLAVAAAAAVAVIGLAGTAYWYRSTRSAARDAPAASPASPSRVRPGRTSSHRDEVATARRKIVDGAPSSGSAAPPRAPGARAPTTKPAAAPAASRKQARTLLSKAQAATKRRDWDAARRLYDRVARGRFDPELGHLGLGQVALAKGDATTAVGHAKRSLRFGGGLPARRVLAHALARLGQYAAAAEQYRMILQREPRDDDSRRGLKDVLRAQRKRR